MDGRQDINVYEFGASFAYTDLLHVKIGAKQSAEEITASDSHRRYLDSVSARHHRSSCQDVISNKRKMELLELLNVRVQAWDEKQGKWGEDRGGVKKSSPAGVVSACRCALRGGQVCRLLSRIAKLSLCMCRPYGGAPIFLLSYQN